MIEGFRNIIFPETLEYRSDNDYIPLEFYISVFPISQKIDMHLGYFSSNAIKILNSVFAQFIYNGGKLRLIINNVLSREDKENLLNNPDIKNEDKIKEIFSNLLKLKNEFEGGQHFFDCLKYLIKENRFEIQPVITKRKTLSHYKNILFYDKEGNILYTEGSANFTANGILTNGESFNVSRSWGDNPEIKRIEKAKNRLEEIFCKKHAGYIYLKPKDVKNAILEIGKDKNANELIVDGYDIINTNTSTKTTKVLKKAEEEFKLFAKKIKEEPRFPYSKPRPFHKSAYNAWEGNGYKGIFAMATGTGKTLTALYCLIEEYKKNKIQKNIFVVPGEELIRQWGKEISECNFINIFLWYSKNNKLKKDIENIRILKQSRNINIVITYESLKSAVFQSMFKDLFNQFTVIFDEVHNMGATGFRNAISELEFERVIGLSATPLRLWDDDGENDFIEELFNSYYPNYTFSFPMKKAIGKFLVNYNYYPYFTHLSDEEFERYLKYTSQITWGKDGEINTTAALKRQLLLDQAENKTNVLLKIVDALVKQEEYGWTLVYCPKGRIDNQDEERIIHNLGELTAEKYPFINIQFFVGETKDRDLLLRDFESKDVHMLFAIKVLDEGVNVPMAQNAIFLASGKNYREFVQRRGRILRKYKTKTFEKTHANIYDIVVIPSLKQYAEHTNTSRKLIVSEFRRLFEFYKMSILNEDVFWRIENELKKYGLTQYYIENIIDNE